VDRAQILLVDDDEDVLAFMGQQLQQAGFATDTAESAEDGLAQMRSKLHWVVVADIHMPGMNGMELINALKTINPLTHVIMCTSDASLTRVVECIGRGAADFFSKGDNPELLVNTVRDAVARAERWRDWLGKRGWTSTVVESVSC
jgi:DNA-binding NtrC family response regulator